MTHESEHDFTDRVGHYLEGMFGEDNVFGNLYLKETGRYADWWVDLDVVILAIEVENDWEAAIKGVGQAILYSKHSEKAIPLVIIPPGHIEEPEATMLREEVHIIELDV